MNDYETGALLVLVGALVFVTSPIVGVALARVWMWVDVTRALRRMTTWLQTRTQTHAKEERPQYKISR